ncbi:MAG: hypothetical protein KAJ62_05930 [Desulfobacteraceae bacterium]|nr:hypothetical protein [Desulfobacteraceae bacterium]
MKSNLIKKANSKKGLIKKDSNKKNCNCTNFIIRNNCESSINSGKKEYNCNNNLNTKDLDNKKLNKNSFNKNNLNKKNLIKKDLIKENKLLKNNSSKKTSGGRTTISPPAKIKQASKSGIRILASNIDTIKLSINIVWKNQSFFLKLKEAKSLAVTNNSEYPISFCINNTNQSDYYFNIKEYGSQGYEWILLNQEYSLLIGNWEKPKSRPSVLLSIRSETLWRKGPREAIDFIKNFLEINDGTLLETKISRLDLCVDALFPVFLWKINMLNYKVTRASSTKAFFTHNILSGVTIGKSDISARMYDKPLEIKQQSKKDWMFDVWNIQKVPDDFKIIRTEFQLRREVIKELGIHTLDILFERICNIWAYCTKEWLKFQDNRDKQSHQRNTFSWWREIQNGFNGMESGHPSIRCKASNADKEALSQQIVGLLSSYAAIEMETTNLYEGTEEFLETTLDSFYDNLTVKNPAGTGFQERVEKKKAKYQRVNRKMMESLELRKQLGFK